MKRPTYKSIREAAKKSKRAAIKSGIQKYLYLMSLSPEQVKELPGKFIGEEGCALCIRYDGGLLNHCPLESNCHGMCTPEWDKMNSARRNHRSTLNIAPNDNYHEFITYATKIYLKLLEL